jgi:formate hydrogenlyase subunit 6/NADH:ubiquinone oxidoreductase subunit I
LIGIGKGMATTLRHFLRPAITEQYPSYRRELPPRARMGFTLTMAEDGSPKCKACMLCERSCPDDAIKIESAKRVDGPGRVLTGFSIDLGRCMYCGLCVEQCNSDGLHHTCDFESAVTTRAETMLVLYHAEPAELEQAPAMEPVSAAELDEVADTFGHAATAGSPAGPEAPASEPSPTEAATSEPASSESSTSEGDAS